MSVELGEQLRMIGESAAAFAAAQGATSRARRVPEDATGWDFSFWKSIADLGWLRIAVPESAGGLELGAGAVCVVAQEAGRALMTPPVTAGMAAAAVLAGGGGAAAPVLDALMAGEQHVALAPAESGRGGELTARLVPDGNAAQWLLLALDDADGYEVRLVGVDAPGVGCDHRVAVDGSCLADVTIERSAWADATPVLTGAAGRVAWRRGTHLLWLGDAAYLCGLMDSALHLALDYMRLRRQFGVPIGSFQALQHRATACHVDVTATRALVHEAARAFGTGRGAWAAAASVHRAAAAALRVTKEVVQFHGAIGFADEHDAGLYLRRAITVGARHSDDALTQLRATAGGPAPI